MLVPRRAQSPRSATAKLPSLTDRYSLAGGALAVSPFCVGMVGDPSVIPAAFDAGVNFFFVTADMHWPLYENTRRGLEQLFARGGGVRDDVVVAVVSYVTQPEFAFAPFEEVVAEIKGLARVDVSLMGGVYPNEFLARLDAYRVHRRASFVGIRGTGATFHHRETAVTAVNHALLDIAYVRYNTHHRGAEADVFAHIEAGARPLIYNFKTTDGFLDTHALDALGLAANDWRPAITDHYRYAFARPELDGILCSFGTPDHVADLARALAQGPLDDEEIQYLNDLADLALGRATLAP